MMNKKDIMFSLSLSESFSSIKKKIKIDIFFGYVVTIMFLALFFISPLSILMILIAITTILILKFLLGNSPTEGKKSYYELENILLLVSLSVLGFFLIVNISYVNNSYKNNLIVYFYNIYHYRFFEIDEKYILLYIFVFQIILILSKIRLHELFYTINFIKFIKSINIQNSLIAFVEFLGSTGFIIFVVYLLKYFSYAKETLLGVFITTSFVSILIEIYCPSGG